MRLPFPLFVALKYFWSKKEGVLSFMTTISILGVFLGVCALILTIGVMSGFEKELKKRIISINPHIVVGKYGAFLSEKEVLYLEKVTRKTPNVLDSYPFIYSQALINANGEIDGVIVKGVTDEFFKLQKSIIFERRDEGTLFVGKELSKNMGVYPGDYVTLFSPSKIITPFGMLPRIEKLKVCGTFSTGIYDYDTTLVILDVRSAQNLFGLRDKYSGVELRLKDPELAKRVERELTKKLKFPYYIRSWMDMNKSLFSAMKLEKFAMFVILVLIVIVASFNIIGTVVLTVIDKRFDIAILKSLGATSRHIRFIFITYALLIGVVGTLSGTLFALFISALLKRYHFIKIPKEVYSISSLPISIEAFDLFIIVICAILIVLLASIYPARKAEKLDISKILRYG